MGHHHLTTYNTLLGHQTDKLAFWKGILIPAVYYLIEAKVKSLTKPSPQNFPVDEEIHISHVDRLIPRGQTIDSLVSSVRIDETGTPYLHYMGKIEYETDIRTD